MLRGQLDASFGSGGKVLAAFGTYGSQINAVAIMSDGRIVVGGSESDIVFNVSEWTLARYNSNGTLDYNFGDGGVTISEMGYRDASIQSLRLLDNGGILAAGTANGNLAVGRYKPTGYADSSFGQGGFVLTDVAGGADAARSLAVEADGHVLAVGSAQIGSATDLAIARYSADGALDSSFGVGGILRQSLGTSNDQALAAGLDGSGRLLAAGFTYAAREQLRLGRRPLSTWRCRCRAPGDCSRAGSYCRRRWTVLRGRGGGDSVVRHGI